MEISANMSQFNMNVNSKEVKADFSKKISKEEAQDIKDQISQRSNQMVMSSITAQVEISASMGNLDLEEMRDDFRSFLNDIGYEGKPIAELSQEEAAELVSEDGFFGIEKTAQRIADFVINGASGDEKLMREGREGIIRGFKEAEQMWGGELPEISQKTIDKALESVDKAMHELGYSIIKEDV